MSGYIKLPAAALSPTLQLDSLVQPTALETDSPVPGQERAKSALRFGLNVSGPGYNVFVLGKPEWGCLDLAREYALTAAAKKTVPRVYAYVQNFTNPKAPQVISLSACQGRKFCRDMAKLIDELALVLPVAFGSPDYQQKKMALQRKFSQRVDGALDLVRQRGNAVGVGLNQNDEVIEFTPLAENGSPPGMAAGFGDHVEALENYLAEVLVDLPMWRLSLAESLKQLNNTAIQNAVSPLFAGMKAAHSESPEVLGYLDTVKSTLCDTVGEFAAEVGVAGGVADSLAYKKLLASHYLPNLLVDVDEAGGAPVIYEANPTRKNLFGRIEYVNEQGVLTTNHLNIFSGALHRANGGFLILDALKLLDAPDAWDALKRALKSGQVSVETLPNENNPAVSSLQPHAIAVDIKILLLGSEDDYYLLTELDEEFAGLFKVLADFDPYVSITAATLAQFSHVMQRGAATHTNCALAASALIKLAEYSCRQAEHQGQLSANLANPLDLITEAAFYQSQQADSSQLDASHIEQAIQAKELRNNRESQAVLEAMLDGSILIATTGNAIGKINGLTIIEMGGCSFGAPARITATVYPGSRGIVDIEREVELGQAIHSKGVMILSGYLGHCYAQQFPLAISANIAIEQSYGFIDGDSASLAELCCLISALTRTPVSQGIAVTGSINQYGEVQAIGGINEKIEGFFRLCQARGLDGRQGVVVPAANQRNLVLDKAVIEAVQDGLFVIYAVATVDQALEILTGQVAGTIDKEGNYPADSLNAKAIARLKEISDLALDEDKEDSAV